MALKPAAMRPEGHGQEGTWTHPFATWGQPSTLKVPRKAPEGCILRRKPFGHGGRSIPANDEPAHRFGGCARACALMGSGSAPRGSAIHEQGCGRRGLRHRHGRREPYPGTRRHAQSARKGSKRARTDSPSKVSRGRVRALAPRDPQHAPFPRNDSPGVHPDRRSHPQAPVAPFDRLDRSGALRPAPVAAHHPAAPPPCERPRCARKPAQRAKRGGGRRASTS